MRRFLVAVALVSLIAGGASAWADPSLVGPTGLLRTPTAYTLGMLQWTAGATQVWAGSGPDEKAVVAWSENEELGFRAGDLVVQVDPRYYRPAEVETLLGDASLAREKLGWVPKTSFSQMVDEMVATDLRLAREESLIDRDRSQN